MKLTDVLICEAAAARGYGVQLTRCVSRDVVLMRVTKGTTCFDTELGWDDLTLSKQAFVAKHFPATWREEPYLKPSDSGHASPAAAQG